MFEVWFGFEEASIPSKFPVGEAREIGVLSTFILARARFAFA